MRQLATPWADSVVDWTWDLQVYIMPQTNEPTTQVPLWGSFDMCLNGYTLYLIIGKATSTPCLNSFQNKFIA